jgi:PilZ domain
MKLQAANAEIQGKDVSLKGEEAPNRRRHMRYPLRGVAHYRWWNAQGLLSEGKGWTRNVSEGGILVASRKCPTRGDRIELTLRMPRKGTAVPNPTPPMQMLGEVVREVIDDSGKTICGFAIATRGRAQRTSQQIDLMLPAGDSERPRWN